MDLTPLPLGAVNGSQMEISPKLSLEALSEQSENIREAETFQKPRARRSVEDELVVPVEELEGAVARLCEWYLESSLRPMAARGLQQDAGLNQRDAGDGLALAKGPR
ncbi:MAG TPA: hypothetical protein P5186_24485 [Candidatus Paceibacterota bacterium]|nr:hypothetical protein [Verrucomicrobiota bacterium]HRY51221.1 hypothetical protein [Candidatus Paceibacterota bacterium]